ncbi:MAG: ABC transporter ATP-binding protein [bacterium]
MDIRLSRGLEEGHPVISFRGVSKEYRGVWAVKDISLTISSGELVGILGPNGAGKTTLLKVGAGLVRPTEGSVEIGGKDILHYPEETKEQVGYVPDQPYLYETLTGREFMFFCAGLYRMNGGVTSRRVNELFELFGIGSWGDRRCGEYSHGMRQRLVMASAFLHSPSLLLVDEPFVGLDPSGMHLLKDVLREFSAQGGAVILSTHTLRDAEELCSKVAILNKGQLGDYIEVGRLSQGGRSLEEVFMNITSS